jgi:transmembrane sensor
MQIQNSKQLLEKYLAGQCTEDEEALIESWYLEISGKQKDDLREPDYMELKQEIFNAISLGEQQQPVKIKSLWLKVAAAVIAVAISAGLLFYDHQEIKPSQLVHDEIRPGGNKAVLTLSNGKKIILNDAKNGDLAKQGNIRVSKAKDGQIIYSVIAHQNNPVTSSQINTIETPAGGQYQVVLPDGTNVWLNAKSTLRYPVVFSKKERKVELTGEGYFQVAHNKLIPFLVQSGGQLVEVLGTHFNINTYSDEPVAKTTLLQGSVRITYHGQGKLLRPGQQASVKGGHLSVGTADADQTIAWKNGDFAFEGTQLKTIMRQISRWYNVDVSYKGNIADDEFGGSISRSKDIYEVLKVLESTQGVHFKIEGRRILVMP